MTLETNPLRGGVASRYAAFRRPTKAFRYGHIGT